MVRGGGRQLESGVCVWGEGEPYTQLVMALHF